MSILRESMYGPVKLDSTVENWPYEGQFDKKEDQVQTGWSSSYYELPPDAKEVQDLIEHRNMNFAVGNIFKAAYRLGNKKGTDRAYDLRKIIWFAERELAKLGKEKV
jgi:hypothetical protein